MLDDPAVALRRKLEWYPDSLGNWAGLDEATLADLGLIRTDKTPGNDPTTVSIRHQVDSFNRITGVTTDSQTVAHINDSAGNLVFDGSYVYQYDAWNRLVEVNQAGTLTTDDFTPDGKISPVGDPVHVIGDLVVRFQYDALGRLIMAQRVHSGSPPDPVYRAEHYYYDGVRRVQEVDDNATPTTAGDDETRHEYVYGPDYVDEFVLESQKTVSGQQPFYILQDANYNVMALLDDTGAVVEQYQWEPYGLLAAKDTDTSGTAPHNQIGHQGLFFYRFDDSSGPPIAMNAVGLYFNRNRWYSPSLGRFTSRDPNETAQLLLIAMQMNGQNAVILAGVFDGQSHFSDGMNLFIYARSNPVLLLDPLGAWTYTEIGVSTGIQVVLGALMGGWSGGWKGALVGAGVGLVTGPLGAIAQSAFAGSAAGFWGTLAGRGVINGVQGVAQSFLEGKLMGQDRTLTELAFTFAIGVGTGGFGHLGRYGMTLTRGWAGTLASSYWGGKLASKWAQLGFKTPQALQNYIEKLLSGSGKAMSGGRVGYWDPKTGVSIILEEGNPMGGTIIINNSRPPW